MLELGTGTPTAALRGRRLPGLLADWAGGRYVGRGVEGVDEPAWRAATGMSFSRSGAGLARTSAGGLVGFAAGAPRITDRGLLIEAERTNLALRNRSLDHAAWTRTNCSVTADAATAPDGASTADRIVGAVGTSVQRISQTVPTVPGARYTVSACLKAIAGESRWTFLRDTALAGSPVVNFDLLNGVVGSVGSGWLDARVTALADGWRRVEAGFVAIAATHAPLIGPADANSSASFTGDGVKGLLAWGVQIEAGAGASSVIATDGASVTRGADEAALPLPAGASRITVEWGAASTTVLTPGELADPTLLPLGASSGRPWVGERIRRLTVLP